MNKQNNNNFQWVIHFFGVSIAYASIIIMSVVHDKIDSYESVHVNLLRL